jgi:hypothetical protein
VTERKGILLRLDPAVHDALARWANDELRSTNAQIEFLLRRALDNAGRLPRKVAPMRPRGRPAAAVPAETSTTADDTLGVSDELVGEAGEVVTHGAGAGQAQGFGVAGLAEEAVAGAEHERVDHQP